MKQKVIFMFSGQGSQYYQMGRELYEKNARFQLWMNHCDDIFREYNGVSILDSIYLQGNKTQLFDDLLQTNPALFAIQYSMSRLFIESGIKPDFVLGYSIGELVAAVVAGVISLEDGAKLAADYARLVVARSPKGTMVAVMESGDVLEDILSLHRGVWIAGRNFASHSILAGLRDDIDCVIPLLDQRKTVYQRLPVNYAFHSPAIGALKEEFDKISHRVSYASAKTPIISPLLTSVVHTFDAGHMWSVVSEPVYFEKTIRQLITDENFLFVDLGPSGTLATFVKYLLPRNSGSQQMEVMNQYGKDINSFQKVVKHFSFAYE